jgi:photosystem II stability/assembly factor-like uncharacterized protein
MKMERENKMGKKFIKLLIYSFILILFIAFNFQDCLVNGWYKQTLPNINNIPISDICFLDSLKGIILTGNQNPLDTSYILKTTNGGNNWNIVKLEQRDFTKVMFINKDTGFVAGGYGNGAVLYKTTNSGDNWFQINDPGGHIIYNDMFVLNKDTFWLVENNQLTGGVFRTTNGGQNWIQQVNLNIYNPQKIYMINKNNGFITDLGYTIYRTSNGGFNWTQTDYGSGHYYYDMHFYDSTIGYRAYALDSMLQKTTNGGISWFSTSQFPIILGTPYYSNYIRKFTLLNKDTLWVSGGHGIYPNGVFGVIYKTTNGGLNWGYQMPDTSFHLNSFYHIIFTKKLYGWAYNQTNTGIHTVIGGSDTTIYTNIKEQTTNSVFQFKLYQNYPNPFNPITKINYELPKDGRVKLVIYDILGREIKTLVNELKQAGRYTVEFNGTQYASGVYFFRIQVDGGNSYTAVKKMMLVK